MLHSLADSLLQKKKSLEDSIKELKYLVDQYPFFSTAQLLLAAKLKQTESEEFEKQLNKTSLFFPNSLWLDFTLSEELKESNTVELSKEETAIVQPTTEKTVSQKPTDDLLLDPYHRIDYFASQGIKFVAEEKPTDRIGQQMKSFTDWLKTLKQMPNQTSISEKPSLFEEKVIQLAGISIDDRRIITEAMADVWIKQNEPEKAIEVYQKLSLLEPAKSSYFASLIEKLKKN